MPKNINLKKEDIYKSFPDFLEEKAEIVAKKLLGCYLERTINKKKILVRIVETEAYDEQDEASHAYLGKTKRNEVMFGESGRLYVYFTYGMHYCCNIVCGKKGYGAGALIRAVEPVSRIEILEKNRKGIKGKNLTNGPAKITQALQIDFTFRGHNLRKSPLRLINGKLNKNEKVVSTTRIGISKAKDKLRRFYIQDNIFVSKK